MNAITLGMLVALLLGLNMSWSAITVALTIIFLDFKDSRPCLEKVIVCPPVYLQLTKLCPIDVLLLLIVTTMVSMLFRI